MSTAVQDLRVPPHSIQAEQSVLGGLMLVNETWDVVVERVAEDDFFRKDHRLIFRSIRMLAENQSPFDVVTLSEVLARHGWLEDASGLAYLATMAKETPSAANIAAYADIVREKSILRQIIYAGTQIAEMGLDARDEDASVILERAESIVFRIADQRSKGTGTWVSLKEAITGATESVQVAHDRGGSILGISTGLAELDRLTNGLSPGDLVIVAGRPAMGKTSLAMDIGASISKGHVVAVFSMEMPVAQLAARMLSSMGHIDNTRLQTGQLEDDEWPRMTSALNILADRRMFIDDSPGLSPFEIRARCRRLARQEGKIGLVILDYLQLMEVPGMERDPVAMVSLCSKSLKNLAKELRCPIIALSQLNRELEKRTNKRPLMSDLRQSGAIEQDADKIIFVYRDEVYNPESPDKGTAELIVGKNRNGPTGTARVTFLGPYTKFQDMVLPGMANSMPPYSMASDMPDWGRDYPGR